MAILSVLSAAVFALSTASRTPATLYVSPTGADTSPCTATARMLGLSATSDFGDVYASPPIRSASATFCSEPTTSRKSPATGACNAAKMPYRRGDL